ncbi:hypothetical protein CSE_00690 [Caldisericum exile AZM16c01]|uniref:Uncharacterized protein n=1 Tax=Caldisericum exile (strain DSM 21853 / NBRC 104410 / AZM16c01) TaxID=511051 RepID=A0A7U6JFI9_CALEA|nr:hypothetical protein CSE_00690 [Caldisericum exile AZM16c01]
MLFSYILHSNRRKRIKKGSPFRLPFLKEFLEGENKTTPPGG